MSSLNATQADGYYVPPAYLDSGAYKSQSVSQFAGSKGHNQYLTRSVVRFELPYDGFCTECDGHVGRGTRFNAHKAHVDDYFTTKIWEFTTKCRQCRDCTFKVRTNPRERGFDYVGGIRKKVEEFDTREAGTAGVIDTELGGGIVESSGPPKIAAQSAAGGGGALSRLERTAAGRRRALTEHDRLDALIRLNDSTRLDDASSNAALRSEYRTVRRGRKRRLGGAAAVGLGRGIELADPLEEDATVARDALGSVEARDGRARGREREAFSKVRTGSIFGGSSKQAAISARKAAGKGSMSGSTRERSGNHARTEDTANRSTKRKRRVKVKPPSLLGGRGIVHLSSEEHKEVQGIDGLRDKQREEVVAAAKEEPLSALSSLADYGSDSD